MACSLTKIKDDSKDKVREIIIDSFPGTYLNPVGNPVLLNEQDANQAIDAVNQWSENLFGKEFNNQWIKVQQSVNSKVLRVDFPTEFENKYRQAL
jgi:hypothetical protein